MRTLVSLVPSGTEIVLALGLADRLVGVTDECPVPPGRHRVVVRARQPAGLSAGEVDSWVREHAAVGGLYELDERALAALAPDVVLTQDLCRVCALPGSDVDTAVARVGHPSAVVTLQPRTLADVVASVAAVADAAGEPALGARVVADLDARLAAVRAATDGRPRVRTLVLEWLEPPYTAGHWVPDVVAAAGGEALLATPGGRSGPTTWEQVLASGPDVVVVSPCGTPREQALAQVALLPDALAGRPVLVADLAAPGPSLVDVVEGLAAVLHPGAGLPRRPEAVAVAR